MARDDTPPRLRVTWYGRTVTGKVRQNNEDTLWAAPLGAVDSVAGDSDGLADSTYPGILLAVADGMGGALAGGCTVGTGLAGLPTLGLAAFLALAAIAAGALATDRALRNSPRQPQAIPAE